MKKMIATYALLMVLSMIFVSCEHKELCYSHPHSAKVSVVFDWSQMPAAYAPGGMRVIFYPRNGGEEIVRDFVGKKGGCVEIPSGVYDVVCFNNDTQRVKYNGADGFSSIAATTGVAQVGDVKAFRTPDYLCGGRMVAVEEEVKIGCEQIIVLPVAPMVCRYTYPLVATGKSRSRERISVSRWKEAAMQSRAAATPLELLIAMCIKQYYIYAQPAVKW